EPVEAWAWDAPADERVGWLRTALIPPIERDGPVYDTWIEALQTSPQVTEVSQKAGWEQVGLKMNDLAAFATEAVADVLYAAKAKAIILTRENRIKHALSLYRYHEEGKSQFFRDGTQAGVRPSSKVKMRAFDRWLKESQRLHSELLRVRQTLAEQLGPDQITDLSYEEFISDEGKRHTLRRLANFLGIEPIELVEGKFTKATSDDLRSAVVNYDLLRLRYSRTPMSHFFED
ncbi:MAG: hypothetical protein ACC658_17120, partial [Acidimicrobiia bacterium]